MRFANRDQAAAMLADALRGYRGQHPLVLGLPRGGVPMARVIADALFGDIDVALVRKLRMPGQPELAIGAVDEAGAVVKGRYFEHAPGDYVEEEVRRQREIISRRRELYTRAQPPIDAGGRIVILVDDGVATGSSMVSAVNAVRARDPARMVVAVAVAPPRSLDTMRAAADEVVCLYSTEDFYAVGQFFDDFSEVSDEQVVAALAHTPAHRPAR
jgi:predicted phosphoribosyltransferase